MQVVGHFINVAMVADTQRVQDVFNPATGLVERQVALASKATVEDAIIAAEAPFPACLNTPPLKRPLVMFLFMQLL